MIFISFSFALSKPPSCNIFTTKTLLPFGILLWNTYTFATWYRNFKHPTKTFLKKTNELILRVGIIGNFVCWMLKWFIFTSFCSGVWHYNYFTILLIYYYLNRKYISNDRCEISCTSSEKMSFYILQYQINGTPYLRKLSIRAKPGFYQKFLSFIMWLQKYMRFAKAFVNCMTNVECQKCKFRYC